MTEELAEFLEMAWQKLESAFSSAALYRRHVLRSSITKARRRRHEGSEVGGVFVALMPVVLLAASQGMGGSLFTRNG